MLTLKGHYKHKHNESQAVTLHSCQLMLTAHLGLELAVCSLWVGKYIGGSNSMSSLSLAKGLKGSRSIKFPYFVLFY